MESFLIKAVQLILSLSILVFVHEMGHFLFARLFKVRVEKFYLFFNPWFSLFKYPKNPKEGETQYGIGWLPLGGYCKIAGMIDESMDSEQMAQPEQPWEFRSKPAYQRLLIMIGGVLFNFVLALLIYSMIVFTWGENYISLQNATAGMEFSQTALDAGFQDGDVLLSADDKELDRFSSDMLRTIVESNQVAVLRNGVETIIPIPEDMMLTLISEGKGFASFILPPVVQEVAPDMPALAAGIEAGDSLVAINDVELRSVSSLIGQLATVKGEEIAVTVARDGEMLTLPLTVDEAGKIGIVFKPLSDFYTPVTVSYNFFQSFPKGIERGITTLKGYVGDMKYVFTKEGAGSVGGFAAIGSLFPTVWNWEIFWNMTAFLSIILAFMNILPIPALDGGHVLFLLYEVVTRRKPSDKFMEYAQTVGMILLLALLLYANGNDLFKFLFK